MNWLKSLAACEEPLKDLAKQVNLNHRGDIFLGIDTLTGTVRERKQQLQPSCEGAFESHDRASSSSPASSLVCESDAPEAIHGRHFASANRTSRQKYGEKID